MNIAFFQFSSNTMHFAASLEILMAEDSNNRIFYSIWGGKTKYLERRASGFNTLAPFKLVKPFKLIKAANAAVITDSKFEFDEKWVSDRLQEFENQISKIDSLDDLQGLKYGDLNPSSALANEVVSMTKFRDADLSRVRIQIGMLLRSYLEVYSATSIFLMKNQIDKVHLYNGRFIHERAVWDCVKAQGLEISLFEVMRDRFLQRKEGFHDRIINQRIMKSHWLESEKTLEEKIEIGSRYFSELRGKSNPFLRTKTSPLKIEKPYFVYFTNSDDEAIGFWEVWAEKLGSQIQCVTQLQKYFENQNDQILVIRIHPNLLNKSKKAIEVWSQLKATSNSLVIGPGDEISSYELLDGAKGSISFGSTLSLESAFAGVPGLVLADCAYDELEAVDKFSSWKEVYIWIENVSELSQTEINRRKINSCIRGYYLATYGFSFNYTKLLHREWGSWDAVSFLGNRIARNRVFELLMLIKLRVKQHKYLIEMESA